jgi:hypothetical protein
LLPADPRNRGFGFQGWILPYRMVQRNAVPGEWHASERETFRGENLETPVGNEEWRRRL